MIDRLIKIPCPNSLRIEQFRYSRDDGRGYLLYICKHCGFTRRLYKDEGMRADQIERIMRFAEQIGADE